MINENLIFFLISIVIIYLLYINNLNNSQCQPAKDSVKKLILKQELVLNELKNKIDRKLVEKIRKSHKKASSVKKTSDKKVSNKKTSDKKKKTSTIESMDNNYKTSTKETKPNSAFNNILQKNPFIDQHLSSMSNLRSYYEPNTHIQPNVDPVYIRDSQVINDKLYPPLGRTERPQFDMLMNYMNTNPLFNVHTRGSPDTFRPIGYLRWKWISKFCFNFIW